MKFFFPVIALVIAGTIGTAHAGQPGKSLGSSHVNSTLSSKQRGALARSLVVKWAPEIRRQGGDVRQWALKMGRFIGTADAANVRQAANMTTYPAMMGVLQGQAVTSDSVVRSLANGGNITANALGSTIADTTYTPLPNGRCRVADSRVISSPLGAGVTRAIDVEDISSYVAYGGNGSTAGDGSTNCGIPSFVTSLAVSVTVLPVAGSEGVFKIFQNGQAFTTGNTVFYSLSEGAASDVIVRSCQACALELSIYSSAQVNYVIDVIGYFMPPEATALDCVNTADVTTPAPGIVPGGTRNETADACPAGYTQTATNCKTNSWLMPIVYFEDGTCSARNNDSINRHITATRTCCRVPGR